MSDSSETMRPTLSVVIITRNEERNIRKCLESARWADEIVVVDACSSDRTIEVTKEYTSHVLVRPWPGFGPQKNYAIGQASGEWVLVLDADERVSPELASEIQARLRGSDESDVVAFRIPRRNMYYGRWVRWGGIYPDYQLRLFRKDSARYNDVAVHENLLVNGAMGTLTGHLDHYTEHAISDHFTRFPQYTTLAAQEKAKTTRVVRWSDLVIRPLVVLTKTYVLKQGFRDGVRGMIVCIFASMYTFVKYAKLWESLNVRSSRFAVRG